MVYVAKDWTGIHIFAEPPSLLNDLPSFPPTWSGHKLPLNVEDSFIEIPRGKYLERNIIWTTVNIINR